MADVYTGTAALDYDQPAWELVAYYAFRPELFFDAVADVGVTNESHTGSSVTFTIMNDLAVASTPLSELVDVSAVALTDSQVTVTLAEYGNSVMTTALMRGTSFIPLDPMIANVLGFNAGVSIDGAARAIVQAGTNVRYAAGSGTAATARNGIVAANTLKAADFRRAYTDLIGNNVPTINGSYFSMLHPDVAYDIKSESGDLGWRDPKVYSDPQNIYNGEIGEFEGFRTVVSPRAPQFVGGGAGTTPNIVTAYRTLFMGRQAIAKAYSKADGNGPRPRVFPGPVTDHLRRFVPMSWYWLGSYGIFRQAALRGVESSSSIGPTS